VYIWGFPALQTSIQFWIQNPRIIYNGIIMVLYIMVWYKMVFIILLLGSCLEFWWIWWILGYLIGIKKHLKHFRFFCFRKHKLWNWWTKIYEINFFIGKSLGNWHTNKIFFVVLKIVAISLGVWMFYWSKII
jgi:hypothetical protein